MIEKVDIKGVEVAPFESELELFDYIDEHKGILVAINAEKILNATDQTRDIINRNLGYVDGAGAMMALHQKGYENACKIPGCELWLKIIEHFHKVKSIYLVGSKSDVIEKTVNKLKEEFPEINIIGYRDGYIKDEEEKKILLKDIEEKKPDIVFVAMGSPKQELLMEEMQERHNAIYQGLGGSFDVYIGAIERAPKWWIDHNLEFAFRLLKQPKRIKRQIHLAKFGLWLLFKKL